MNDMNARLKFILHCWSMADIRTGERFNTIPNQLIRCNFVRSR